MFYESSGRPALCGGTAVAVTAIVLVLRPSADGEETTVAGNGQRMGHPDSLAGIAKTWGISRTTPSAGAGSREPSFRDVFSADSALAPAGRTTPPALAGPTGGRPCFSRSPGHIAVWHLFKLTAGRPAA